MVGVADSVWNDLLGIGITVTVLLLLYAQHERKSIVDVVKDLFERINGR